MTATFGRAEMPSAVPQTRGLIRSHADGWELFKIFIVNLILTFLTLGIYRFWAKTRSAGDSSDRAPSYWPCSAWLGSSCS